MSLDKLIKGVAGAIVLVFLFLVMSNWWGDFKTASEAAKAAGTETSSTATPAAAPQGEGSKPAASTDASAGASAGDSTPSDTAAQASKGTVVVMIEGLNFREKADRGSKAIRALSKGEKVELLDTIDSWYQVKDKNGDIGWISSNRAYAKVEK
ncbi:MAG TPA: SH3 domain-containing protein [Coriobacteriia bacterium]|nr:SH3 domain-containing protein [Coriobacteriia bacterium]